MARNLLNTNRSTMKKFVQIFILVCVSFLANGQNDVRKITCLGETIKNTETGQTISNSRDTGTIFTINENDKTITVRTSARYQGVFLDKFYYEDFIESPYTKIYTCYKVEDRKKTKYLISVLSDKITLMTGSRIIESRIVNR
ncbi:MAG: hypothetical protein ABI549_12590 [Flavobacterium sp.]|uniref:hypothetical protein n=1 Tax=Flavobacterium sp. TaxID=239 RepID=UPI003263D45A